MYYGIVLIPTNTYFDTKCNKYTIPTNLKIKTHNILLSQQHFSSFEILSCANCFWYISTEQWRRLVIPGRFGSTRLWFLEKMSAITASFLVSPWISWIRPTTGLPLHRLPRGGHSSASPTSCWPRGICDRTNRLIYKWIESKQCCTL